MEDYIARPEHEEFCRRVEAEEKRQNKRLDLLEENVRQIGELTASVKQMAVSMENMLEEQKEQGGRLKALEEVPGENWSALRAGIIGAVAAAIGYGIVAALINFM